MNQNDNISNPITQLASKLTTEIEQVEAKEEEIKTEYENLQAEHEKIHHAEEDLKTEHAQLERQRGELEYRLQEVMNEI
jgi:predicted  nucleic acid-binding Zn-ribbon protein